VNRPLTTVLTHNSATKVEAFISSTEAKAALDLIQRQLGRDCFVNCHSGTLATAARLAGMTGFGDILVAELGSEDKAANLAGITELTAEGVRLILLGRQNDVETYRSYIGAGARDYLVLPVEADTQVALGLGQTQAARTPTVASSRVIGVCGVSGGVGASVLATNLAVSYLDRAAAGTLARDTHGNVALIDADLGFGSLAVDLDIDTTPGLLEALLAPERVDHTFLNATMALPLMGLSVYSAEASEAGRIPTYEAGLPALLQKIRADYPTVIIDLPRTVLAQNPGLTDGLDELVLVLGPGFGSIRSGSRLIHRVGDSADGPRMSCVMSQTRRDAGLRKSEISTALGREIDLVLPDCAADLARASVKGKPLQRLSARGSYARTVAKLLTRLETPASQPTETRRGFWRRKKVSRDV
tara:strand:+ start:919 stop:2160 length:1242 start_codon:yes stop_codon:yes gene_type:complete